MITLENCSLTKEELQSFYGKYLKYRTKKGRRRYIFLAVCFFLLSCVALYYLIREISDFKSLFPNKNILTIMIEFFAIESLFTLVCLLQFLNYSLRYFYYLRNKKQVQIIVEQYERYAQNLFIMVTITENELDYFEESEGYCSAWRVSWRNISKVIQTEDIVAFCRTDTPFLLFSKKNLEQEKLKSIELMIQSKFDGSTLFL